MSDRLPITIFSDVFAGTKEEIIVSLPELADHIRGTRAASKTHLPLLSFCKFGNKKSDKGSLRFDENVEHCHGVLIDYDGEELGFEEAVALVREARLDAILYTSPAHTPDKPHWRGGFPFAGAMGPAGYRNMVSRANALFGGTLAPESWTVSQAYYYGLNGQNPDHFLIEVIRGDPIDARPDLGEEAKAETQASTEPFRGNPTAPIGDIVAALAAIPNDESVGRVEWIAIGIEICAASGGSEEGYAAWEAWSSQRSDKFNKKGQRRRAWESFRPTRTGFGALVKKARKRVPDWMPPSNTAPFLSEQWLALEFVAEHCDTARYTSDWNRWHLWDGHRWADDVKLRAFSLAQGLCRRAALKSNNNKTQMLLNQAKTRAAVVSLARENPMLAMATDEWDADKRRLGTPGGIVDLRTGALEANDPSAFITKTTAVSPGGDCPLWKKTLGEIFRNDQEQIDFLQRLTGYSLTGEVSEEALVIMYGEGGNGKGTIVETLLYVFGDYGTPLPLSTLIESKHQEHATEIADLRGKRLVVASEPPDGARWNTARIKALTGGNILKGRFMRADFFKFLPTHKLIIEGNTLPRFGRIDEAIKRRLILWEFKATFRRPDMTLKTRLRGEASGILAWMVEGCLEWQRQGLNPPESVRKDTSAYLAEADDIDMFVADCLVEERGARISSGEVYARWKAWCGDNGVFADTRRSLTDRMVAKGFEGARGAKNVFYFNALRAAGWGE